MAPAVCEQPNCNLWAYTALTWDDQLNQSRSYTPGQFDNRAHWTCLACFEEWLSMREAHQCPWCEKGPYDTVSKWRYRNGFYTYEGEVSTAT